MKNLLYITIALLLISCAGGGQGSEEDKIKQVMAEQEQAWNEGDLEGFMEHYWKDDSLRFVARNGLRYGWQETLDGYKKGYPTKEKMGTLTFDIIQLEVFTASSAYVFGSWQLDGNNKPPQKGYFSLLWRKVDGKWKIVADHTS